MILIAIKNLMMAQLFGGLINKKPKTSKNPQKNQKHQKIPKKTKKKIFFLSYALFHGSLNFVFLN